MASSPLTSASDFDIVDALSDDGSEVLLYLRDAATASASGVASPPARWADDHPSDSEDDFIVLSRPRSPHTVLATAAAAHVDGNELAPALAALSLTPAPTARIIEAAPASSGGSEQATISAASANITATASRALSNKQRKNAAKMAEKRAARQAAKAAALAQRQAEDPAQVAQREAEEAARVAERRAAKAAAKAARVAERRAAKAAGKAAAFAQRQAEEAVRAVERRAAKAAKAAVFMEKQAEEAAKVAERRAAKAAAAAARQAALRAEHAVGAAARKAAKKARHKAAKRARQAGLVPAAAPVPQTAVACLFSAYDEAVKFISSYIETESKDKSTELSFLHALIIELGLYTPVSESSTPAASIQPWTPPSPAPSTASLPSSAPSSPSSDSTALPPPQLPALPTTLTAARRTLKEHVFVNVRDYLGARGHGLGALRAVLQPSRAALLRDLRGGGKVKRAARRMPLAEVKKSGLNVLLVSFSHR